MIVIVGLLILIATAAIAVAGVATNSGSAHALGDSFVVFGQHLDGLSTGELFLYGIVVGVVGMLGLSMLLGAFTRRQASRRSRRELKESRHETTAVRQDRDRLVQQLDDEHTERLQADTSSTMDSSSAVQGGQAPPSGESTTPLDRPTAPRPDPAEGSGIQPRTDHRARP